MPFDSAPAPRCRHIAALPRPIGWDGFRPAAPARSQSNRGWPTGHPSPLRQVEAQLRTPSGYTAGDRSEHGPKLRALSSSRHAPAPPPTRSKPEVPAGLGGMLMDLLYQLQAAGTYLPSCTVLAEDLHISHGAGRVAVELYNLAKSERIFYWHGSLTQHRHQGVLRIVGSDVELRTARAPAEVHV